MNTKISMKGDDSGFETLFRSLEYGECFRTKQSKPGIVYMRLNNTNRFYANQDSGRAACLATGSLLKIDLSMIVLPVRKVRMIFSI